MPIWFIFVLALELGVITGVVSKCIEYPLRRWV